MKRKKFVLAISPIRMTFL